MNREKILKEVIEFAKMLNEKIDYKSSSNLNVIVKVI